MPLKKDEKGGGTNADGSKSVIYCSKCYENGKFTFLEVLRINFFGKSSALWVAAKL
jgi:hypothetical protein